MFGIGNLTWMAALAAVALGASAMTDSDVFLMDPPFRRYFVIVLENLAISKTLKDPYMGTNLTSRGRLLTNYRGVTHPSQPNYIAMVSGSLNGVLTDGDYNVDGKCIADSLEDRGLTWRSYQVGIAWPHKGSM